MIRVDFVDFADMLNFARMLVDLVDSEKTQHPDSGQAVSVPVADVAVPLASVAPVTSPAQPVTQAAAPVAPVATAPQNVENSAPVSSTVPTGQVAYTLDELARAAMVLMDAGRQNELLALLGKFGVDSLPNLPQQQYGVFATALREMGARI